MLHKIQESYLCVGMSEAEVEMLAEIAQVHTANELEMIVRQFDTDCDLFIVLEGRVRITASNGDLVARLRVGAVFGEIALLDERPRSASVSAETDCRLLRLPASQVRQLMDGNCALSVILTRNIARTLCSRLRSANQQIEALLLAGGFDHLD